MSVAVVTGGSRGLGLALSRQLLDVGWTVVVCARDAPVLADAFADQVTTGRVRVVVGDVQEAGTQMALVDEVDRLGRLDLLVNNASILGSSPLPALRAYPLAVLAEVFKVNTFAPLALIQRLLAQLVAAAGVVVDISSDAAVEAYPGWGGYGAAKAALDQLTAVLAAEQPEIRAYSFDPGDMRTQMHQEAYPGEDISDRPEAASVVPALMRLLEQRPPSGRFRAEQLVVGRSA